MTFSAETFRYAASKWVQWPTFLLASILGAMLPSAVFAIDSASAESIVKSASCLDNRSIDAVLSDKIGSSQRDLGWQVFTEEGFFTVEKAVLVSKSMQLRYRWKVDMQGNMQADSERARNLCTPNS